jgi:hypothetical protein
MTANQSTAASPLTSTAINSLPSRAASPELPLGGGYTGLGHHECPETPTPVARPLGSPRKRKMIQEIPSLPHDRIDPMLLSVPENLLEVMSVSENSNDGLSIMDSEVEEEIHEEMGNATMKKKKKTDPG